MVEPALGGFPLGKTMVSGPRNHQFSKGGTPPGQVQPNPLKSPQISSNPLESPQTPSKPFKNPRVVAQVAGYDSEWTTPTVGTLKQTIEHMAAQL